MNKLENNNYHVWDDILNMLTKWWVLLMSGGIMVLGKIGLYLRSDNKKTWWQFIGSVVFAGVVGFETALYCFNHGLNQNQTAFIIPLVSLFSDKFADAILTANLGKIAALLTKEKLSALIEIFFDNSKKKNK